MATKKVVTAAERKAQLLEVGAKLASKHGASNVTRRMVAKAAKVSEALVTNYFGARPVMQNTLGRQAKKLGLTQPTKEQIAKIGAKLRAHKPRDPAVAVKAKPSVRVRGNVITVKTRKSGGDARNVDVSAAVAAAKAKKSLPGPSVTKPRAPKENKALPGPAENKSAAREPKPAPINTPPLPVISL